MSDIKTIIIRVIKTGSDNTARVLGWGITASCTSSPEMAAQRAADKWRAQVKEDGVVILRKDHEDISLAIYIGTVISQEDMELAQAT